MPFACPHTTKSNRTLIYRLIEIDDALRGEHAYLLPDDVCYCMGEYQPRAGFKASEINNLISNLKKSVTKRGTPEYRFKDSAIIQANVMLRRAFGPGGAESCTFIPIPPSKIANDPLYDDRLVRVLKGGNPPLDVRELLSMRESVRAHHEFAQGEKRPTVDDLYDLLMVNDACLEVALKHKVILFDDVLTNGTHFKACKRKILDRIPGTHIIGLFIGRRKTTQPAFSVDYGDLN